MRVEENREMIQSISRARLESRDSAALITVLSDISKSLAVIADTQLECPHSETEPPIFFKDGEAFLWDRKEDNDGN